MSLKSIGRTRSVNSKETSCIWTDCAYTLSVMFSCVLMSAHASAKSLEDIAHSVLELAQDCGNKIMSVNNLFFDKQGRIDYYGATKALRQSEQLLAAVDPGMGPPVAHLISKIGPDTSKVEYEILATDTVNDINREIVQLSQQVAAHEEKINAMEI